MVADKVGPTYLLSRRGRYVEGLVGVAEGLKKVPISFAVVTSTFPFYTTPAL